MRLLIFLLITLVFHTGCIQEQPANQYKNHIHKEIFIPKIKHWELLNNLKDSTLKFQQTILDSNKDKWILTTNNLHYSSFHLYSSLSCGSGQTYIDSISWINKNDTINLYIKLGQINNKKKHILHKTYNKLIYSEKYFELNQITINRENTL